MGVGSRSQHIGADACCPRLASYASKSLQREEYQGPYMLSAYSIRAEICKRAASSALRRLSDDGRAPENLPLITAVSCASLEAKRHLDAAPAECC